MDRVPALNVETADSAGMSGCFWTEERLRNNARDR